MPDADFELITLGGFTLLRAGGAPVELRARKSRALLALLALQPDGRMPRTRIAASLWADRAEAQARGSLRQALSELRRALGPAGGEIIRSVEDQVALDTARIATDVRRFEALTAKDDAASLEAAVALYRGPFLEDLDPGDDVFLEWRLREQTRLESRLIDALCRLSDDREARGDLEAALSHIDRVIELAPLREEAHRRAMMLCEALGRTSAAIERYETLRDRLARELDVAPGIESQQLHERLRDPHASGPHELRASEAPSPVPPADGRPSIAVLPFTNLSDDPDQAFFADGMTEDIITELSRFRGLFVIARNSTFAYKGRTVDSREIAAALGVKYVLEGSVRRAGNRLRVSGQLIDASRRSPVWADRYDREVADLFSLQDEIVRTLVAAVEPELLEAERRQATAASAERLDAWGAYHRGMWHVYRFTAEDTERALALFTRATEVEPGVAAGWIGRSFAHFSNAFLGFVGDRERERRLCLETARRAVELDDRDAAAHWALGRACSLARDYDLAIAALEHAVALNANHAQSWYQLGWVRVRAGRAEEAIDPLRLAARLSPNDPLTFAFLIARSQAHFVLCEYDRALALAERAARLPRAHAQIEAIRIACLVKEGREDEAREAGAAFRLAHPDFSRSFFRESHGFARERDVDPYLEALERAGIPA